MLALTTKFHHRRKDSLIHRPSKFSEARSKNATRESKKSVPCVDCHRSLETSECECNAFCFSGILSLFKLRRPSAIIREIAKIIIDSLNRETLGASAHIRQKVFKFIPSLADGNTPSAVGREVFVPWIPASVAHLVPTHVSWSSGHTVSPCTLGKRYFPNTSAVRRSTNLQRSLIYSPLRSAVASAPAITTVRQILPENNPLSEPLSAKIPEIPPTAIDGTNLFGYERNSFIHGVIMFGVSEPSVSAGGFARTSWLTTCGGQA